MLPVVQVRWLLGLVPFSRGWTVAVRLAAAVVGGGGLAGAALLGQSAGALALTTVVVGATYLWLLSRRGDDLGLRAIVDGVRRR